MDIYVGNLSYQATEDDVRRAFEAFGEVTSVAIIKDKETGRSKGFAFVEMPVEAEAQAAIAALDGEDLKDRTLTVNMARPRTERRPERGGGQRQGRGGQGQRHDREDQGRRR